MSKKWSVVDVWKKRGPSLGNNRPDLGFHWRVACGLRQRFGLLDAHADSSPDAHANPRSDSDPYTDADADAHANPDAPSRPRRTVAVNRGIVPTIYSRRQLWSSRTGLAHRH
jgi:hypothetical protein